MNNSNKESLEFIKKYKTLSQQDPNFESDFIDFFEKSIIDYQLKIITPQQLDEQISNYISDYAIKKRNKTLNSILGKKK